MCLAVGMYTHTHARTHTHTHTGMYRLEATNSLGSVEQQVRVTVSAEHEESPSHSANLGPVSVDQLGGYVTELHTSDNHMFKANYKVCVCLRVCVHVCAHACVHV